MNQFSIPSKFVNFWSTSIQGLKPVLWVKILWTSRNKSVRHQRSLQEKLLRGEMDGRKDVVEKGAEATERNRNRDLSRICRRWTWGGQHLESELHEDPGPGSNRHSPLCHHLCRPEMMTESLTWMDRKSRSQTLEEEWRSSEPKLLLLQSEFSSQWWLK